MVNYLDSISSLNEFTTEVFPQDLDQIAGSCDENQVNYLASLKGLG